MPYIKKTFMLRYKIEVEKVHSSRYGGKGIKYCPKVNPIKAEVEAVNERNRIKKLYRKIAVNFDFGDYHTVLTYKREERPDPDGARKRLRKFLRKLRLEYKRLGYELKYIITTEYKASAIHHHLVINEIGNTAKLVRRLWKNGNVFFTVIYENGQVDDLAAYLIKETQNSFRDADNPSKLSYSCSRNLINPKETIEVVQAENWLEIPIPPAGYWIKKDSIISGISRITGYPYQYYTCIRCDPETMKDDDVGWIRPREKKKVKKDEVKDRK